MMGVMTQLAGVFGGGWQTLSDALRVVVIILGFLVAVGAAQAFINPFKRKYAASTTKPGVLALTFFAVSASFTEIGRLGHDVGYWRLPVNLFGLAAAALTLWRTRDAPSERIPSRDRATPRVAAQEERVAALGRELDEPEKFVRSRIRPLRADRE